MGLYYYLLLASPSAESTVGWDTIKGAIQAILDQFSVTNIVSIIGGVLAITAGFIFLWWGVRKGFRALLSATKKGKASV